MILFDALHRAETQIARFSRDNPRQQAQWLLQAVLNTSSVDVLAAKQRALTDNQIQLLNDFVQRRMQGEPLQYILGTAEFRRILLKVDRRALIPRPETEGLVEIGLELICDLPHPTILDIGTGCGAIGLSFIDEDPRAIALGCEISAEALDLAAENAQRLNLDHRMVWKRADLFDPLFSAAFEQRFDVVACNPPYVSEDEYRELPAEIRDHEPPIALLAGEDGLDAIRRLAQVGQELLKDSGYLTCEIGARQKGAALQIFNEFGWDAEVKNDLSGKPRYVVAAVR